VENAPPNFPLREGENFYHTSQQYNSFAHWLPTSSQPRSSEGQQVQSAIPAGGPLPGRRLLRKEIKTELEPEHGPPRVFCRRYIRLKGKLLGRYML